MLLVTATEDLAVEACVHEMAIALQPVAHTNSRGCLVVSTDSLVELSSLNNKAHKKCPFITF